MYHPALFGAGRADAVADDSLVPIDILLDVNEAALVERKRVHANRQIMFVQMEVTDRFVDDRHSIIGLVGERRNRRWHESGQLDNVAQFKL